MDRRTAIAALAAVLSVACGKQKPYAGAAAAAPPADLPARVLFRAPAESFTHEWYVALRAGRIWIKPTAEVKPEAASEPWRLLPPDGFAHHGLRSLSGPPPAVREISADGDNLVAVGDDGLVYYMKFHDFSWIDGWGLLPFGGPLYVPSPYLGVAISHRGPLARYYEDIDGNAHPVTAGVTTFYRLSADGRRLGYADPWLPATFARDICTPERGRAVLVALAASASTLFVVDAAARTWTRLADYDTLGDNPVLGYSWRRARRGWDQERTLPGEGWRAQPPLPGRATARITIFQTGQGNAARTLRVEGVDADGNGGFWTKGITDAAWTFVRTGQAPAGPFLDAASPPPQQPSRARRLRGAVRGRAPADGDLLELDDLDADCPPATLRLGRSGARVEIPLHLHRPERDADGRVRSSRGALLPPPEARQGPAAPLVRELLGESDIVEVALDFGDTVVMRVTSESRGLADRGREIAFTTR